MLTNDERSGGAHRRKSDRQYLSPFSTTPSRDKCGGPVRLQQPCGGVRRRHPEELAVGQSAFNSPCGGPVRLQQPTSSLLLTRSTCRWWFGCRLRVRPVGHPRMARRRTTVGYWLPLFAVGRVFVGAICNHGRALATDIVLALDAECLPRADLPIVRRLHVLRRCFRRVVRTTLRCHVVVLENKRSSEPSRILRTPRMRTHTSMTRH